MLNSTRSILNCFRSFENALLDSSKIISVQQKRTTYILKRKYPPGLHKISAKEGGKMKNRHFIYEVLQSPYDKPMNPIDVILTDYVEGIGEKGDRFTLKHSIAYNKLLLPKLAVYASPENIKKYITVQGEKTLKFSSPYVQRTMNVLSVLLLGVEMNIDNPWTLERWHIKNALRRFGIHCPEEAIAMPEKEISGPDLELQNKEFYVTVTINNREEVKVRCRIHHVHFNSSLSAPLEPDYYKYPASPIFPEDKEILDSMPRHRQSTVSRTATDNGS